MKRAIFIALCLSCSSTPRPMDNHTREKIITALRAIADTIAHMPAMDASAPVDASEDTYLPRSI